MENDNESRLSPAGPSMEQPGRRNFLLRLWRGDVSLPITYWVFWAGIGGGVFSIISAVIVARYAELMLWKHGLHVIHGFFWLIFAYTLFMAVPVWRSASKHKGSKFWAIVAKVIVALGVLTVAFYALMKVGLVAVSDSELQKEMANLDRGLPVMLDDVTRMERAYLSGRNMQFELTLLNANADAINREVFTQRIRGSLIPLLCQDRQLLAAMNDGRKVLYHYRDESGGVIGDVAIGAADCEQIGD